MNIGINNGIAVDIKATPKKKKADNSLYDIYLLFTITQNGVKQFTPAISTGITVPVTEWGLYGMKGKSEKAKIINNRLSEHVNQAKARLELLRLKEIEKCSEVQHEILNNIKTFLTGKAPKGKTSAYEARKDEWTVDNVMRSLFAFRNLSPERQRIYMHAISILHQFFKNETPLITNISERNLTAFKTWFRDTYRTKDGKPPKQNTATTWFTMIAAVFKHAEKQMKILPVSPLPEKFRGAFVDAEREVLSEADCLKLIGLEDKNLSKTECIAKYCLILQLLTGMGYGDMKSLTREHCKFDTNHNRWYLMKRRNKTEEGFTVYLTPRARYSFDRLRELSGGTETLFELPSIDYTNRTYKEIAKKAGVKLITTYLLRHTFAVSCLDNGTPLEDIQKMLGHKDLRTTQIYAKVSRKRLFEKISELEQRSRIHQL